MTQKRGVILIVLVAFILVFSMASFASAFSFSEFFGKIKAKITGKAVYVCTDTDNGKNYYVNGNVTYNNIIIGDGCDGSVLYENYCLNNAWAEEAYNCPYGCSSGRCLYSSQATTTPSASTPSQVCTDSDGVNYEVQGNVKTASETYIDVCYSSTGLIEYACNADGSARKISYTCQSGYECKNGACIRSLTTTPSASTPSQTCTDSDGGRNYTKTGYVNYAGISYYDIC